MTQTRLRPQQLPLSMHPALIGCVTLGPEQGAARAPEALAFGPIRPASNIADLEADCDAMNDIFARCPIRQWGAAAQAAMSVGAWDK